MNKEKVQIQIISPLEVSLENATKNKSSAEGNKVKLFQGRCVHVRNFNADFIIA